MHVDELAETVMQEAAVAAPSSGGGIIVFSSKMEVLYMSLRALDLAKSIQQAEVSVPIPGVIPTAIYDFCAKIIENVAVRGIGNTGISCEIRRMAGIPERPVVLRGFALANGAWGERSHMVIILEERSGHC